MAGKMPRSSSMRVWDLKKTKSNYVACYRDSYYWLCSVLNKLCFLPDWSLFPDLAQEILEFHSCCHIHHYCTGRPLYGSPDKFQMEHSRDKINIEMAC